MYTYFHLLHSSEVVWKSRGPSWAPIPNKPIEQNSSREMYSPTRQHTKKRKTRALLTYSLLLVYGFYGHKATLNQPKSFVFSKVSDILSNVRSYNNIWMIRKMFLKLHANFTGKKLKHLCFFPSTFMPGHGLSWCNHQDQDQQTKKKMLLCSVNVWIGTLAMFPAIPKQGCLFWGCMKFSLVFIHLTCDSANFHEQ